jgi:allophanate hydrolase subunit 2
MSGIGPAPLSAGAILPVASGAGIHPVGEPEVSVLAGAALEGDPTTLRVVLGPRDDWFGAGALRTLTGQDWGVTGQSNRIGVRLAAPEHGQPLMRARRDELPSEGTVAGSLQVPPDGNPVLFLADHPVSGGYPVIAVVVPEDLPVAAQLPPGHCVRFVVVDPASGGSKP